MGKNLNYIEFEEFDLLIQNLDWDKKVSRQDIKLEMNKLMELIPKYGKFRYNTHDLRFNSVCMKFLKLISECVYRENIPGNGGDWRIMVVNPLIDAKTIIDFTKTGKLVIPEQPVEKKAVEVQKTPVVEEPEQKQTIGEITDNENITKALVIIGYLIKNNGRVITSDLNEVIKVNNPNWPRQRPVILENGKRKYLTIYQEVNLLVNLYIGMDAVKATAKTISLIIAESKAKELLGTIVKEFSIEIPEYIGLKLTQEPISETPVVEEPEVIVDEKPQRRPRIGELKKLEPIKVEKPKAEVKKIKTEDELSLFEALDFELVLKSYDPEKSKVVGYTTIRSVIYNEFDVSFDIKYLKHLVTKAKRYFENRYSKNFIYLNRDNETFMFNNLGILKNNLKLLTYEECIVKIDIPYGNEKKFFSMMPYGVKYTKIVEEDEFSTYKLMMDLRLANLSWLKSQYSSRFTQITIWEESEIEKFILNRFDNMDESRDQKYYKSHKDDD